MISTACLSRYYGHPVKRIFHSFDIYFHEEAPVRKATFCFELLYRQYAAEVSTLPENYIRVNGNKARLDFDSIYLDLHKLALISPQCFTTRQLFDIITDGLKDELFHYSIIPYYYSEAHNTKHLVPQLPTLEIPLLLCYMKDVQYRRTMTSINNLPIELNDVHPKSEIKKQMEFLSTRMNFSKEEIVESMSKLAAALKKEFYVMGTLDLVINQRDAMIHHPAFNLGSRYFVQFGSPFNDAYVYNKGDSWISRGTVAVIDIPYGKPVVYRSKCLRYEV